MRRWLVQGGLVGAVGTLGLHAGELVTERQSGQRLLRLHGRVGTCCLILQVQERSSVNLSTLVCSVAYLSESRCCGLFSHVLVCKVDLRNDTLVLVGLLLGLTVELRGH